MRQHVGKAMIAGNGGVQRLAEALIATGGQDVAVPRGSLIPGFPEALKLLPFRNQQKQRPY